MGYDLEEADSPEELEKITEGARKFLTLTLYLDAEDQIIGTSNYDIEGLEAGPTAMVKCRAAAVILSRAMPQLLSTAQAVGEFNEMVQAAFEQTEQPDNTTPKETTSDDSNGNKTSDETILTRGIFKQHGQIIH